MRTPPMRLAQIVTNFVEVATSQKCHPSTWLLLMLALFALVIPTYLWSTALFLETALASLVSILTRQLKLVSHATHDARNVSVPCTPSA